MWRPPGRLNELNEVSPEIAWKLVDTLFRQTSSLLSGASAFMLLGVIGFVGSGSFWYLGGLAFAGTVAAWRLWQIHVYTVSRESASAVTWARRSILGGWVNAAGWGAWSTVVLFEPEKTFVITVIGVLAGTLLGAAVRSSAVRAAAEGQIFLTLTPLCFACLVSGDNYLVLFAGFVALHILTALMLTKFLHRQTLQLLRQGEEKSELAERLEVARLELEVINSHLENLAATDALTGIANRRAFDLAAEREWRRSIREGTPLSLLLLDVDYFKAFNDTYGHPAGDTCLREVASTAASALRRPGDLLARYGGEEFVALLPQTDLAGASDTAELILRGFADRTLPHEASPLGHVTVSIGVACMFGVPDGAVEQLTARADAAVYVAKRNGRNCLHVADMPVIGDADAVIHEPAGAVPPAEASVPARSATPTMPFVPSPPPESWSRRPPLMASDAASGGGDPRSATAS